MAIARMTSRESLRDTFFVTRAKTNLQFTRHHSKIVDRLTGLRSDHVGKPTLEIPALTVAMLYKLRWRIELFFRWIKGHLRIKQYHATSSNAVKTQIWKMKPRIQLCDFITSLIR
jgi:IS4 transposase